MAATTDLRPVRHREFGRALDYHGRTMPDPSAPSSSGLPTLSLGAGAGAFNDAVARAREEGWVERLFARDASLWSSDPRVQAAIGERLGWLDAPTHFADRIAALEGFGEGIRDAGFTTAIVAGMGGSSLAPDVLARTFGPADDWLALRVLDSTDPAAVAATFDDLEPLATLLIIASKSGTTTEPLAFMADAWARIEGVLRARHAPRFEHAGEMMVAISDPGKSIESIPHYDELREFFLNPPDIGGRYSALSYVGLVPASLIGLDLDALLASAGAMLAACNEPDPELNPGVGLGLAIGTLARAGRDKLTFLVRSRDRVVRRLGGAAHRREHRQARRRDRARRPGADRYDRPLRRRSRLRPPLARGRRTATRRPMRSQTRRRPAAIPSSGSRSPTPIDLAAEFVRWEVATAIAGAVLGIDPFDQPNVEEAKQRTRDLLAGHGDTAAPAAEPIATEDGLALYGDAPLRLSADGEAVARGRAAAPPRPAPRQRLPRDPGVHRPVAGARRGDRPDPDAAPRRDRLRDDGRLRAALPPLDRAAPQGRRPDRLVHPADLRTIPSTGRSPAGRTRSAG